MGYVLATRQWMGPATWAFSYFITSCTGRLKSRKARVLYGLRLGPAGLPAMVDLRPHP